MKTKKQKRTEAEARQKVYDEFSPKEKLNRLNKGEFIATRQRSRLIKESKP